MGLHNVARVGAVVAVLAILPCVLAVASEQLNGSPTPTASNAPTQVVISFTRLEPKEADARSGFYVSLEYAYPGKTLYVDGIGDVPSSGAIETVTSGDTITFRTENGGIPLLTVNLLQEYQKSASALAALPVTADPVRAGALQSIIGETVSAEQSLHQLLQSNSDTQRAYAHYILGNAALDRGDVESATREYSSSVRLAESSALQATSTSSSSTSPAGKPVSSAPDTQSSPVDLGDSFDVADISSIDARSQLQLATIYAADGNPQLVKKSIAALPAATSDASLNAQIRAASAANVVPKEGAISLLGDAPPGPRTLSDSDFRSFNVVEWGHARSELRGRFRAIMLSYFGDTYPRQGPCAVVRPPAICMVSDFRTLGNSHFGWDARIVFRVVAFVDDGGHDAVRLDDATAERLDNPVSPSDDWISIDSPSAAPTATRVIQGDRKAIEHAFSVAVERIAQ